MKWTKKIEDHYTQNWQISPKPCPFNAGPIHELPPEFKILLYPPHAARTLWTYATCGMSLPEDPIRTELHLFSPVVSERLVELLFAIAHFHRTGARLDLNHTVNFGRSWLGSSICTVGLVSLPYLDGPELENLETLSGTIKFYWLIPITKAELNLKISVSTEALEAQFEASGINYSDPNRKSVV